jgi:hypothetical protein
MMASDDSDRRVLAPWQVRRVEELLAWGRVSNSPTWWIDRQVNDVIRCQHAGNRAAGCRRCAP